MYFKETKTDTGKTSVLQLIESVRINKGPRQKIIVSLGTDLKIPKKLRKQVAHCVKELLLSNCGFNKSQITTAEISVLNRLISQDSEHAIISWLNTVAIDEVVNIDSTKYGDDRFYRVSDILLKNQSHIETALYE